MVVLCRSYGTRLALGVSSDERLGRNERNELERSFAAPKPATPAPPALPILKVFQFPSDQIPRIDGKDDDWAIVPESYTITLADMHDDQHIHAKPDPKDHAIHVKVGWGKGLHRLYFIYEAYDNYWDFADPGLHNDTFEVVVDGDRSG